MTTCTHPIRVTLCFRTEAERRYVMGQLSDGFGENELDMEWDVGDLHEANEVRVKPMGETWEHSKRIDARRAKRLRRPL